MSINIHTKIKLNLKASGVNEFNNGIYMIGVERELRRKLESGLR